MRFPLMALACVLAATTASSTAAQSASGAGLLTLAEAMRLAETAHPSVRAREAQLSAAEGTRREAAALLFNNPGFSVDKNRRRSEMSAERSTEWSVGIAQPIEIAGQQGRRREAAAAALEALRAEIDQVRRQARTDAALRFYAVLAAQRRVQIEQRSVELFDSTAQAVDKRRAAGEDTRLDANVALIEAERARNALAVASEQVLDARKELATALQLPPSELPEVDGELGADIGDASRYALDQLLASAQGLPKQRALAAREDAARARLGVENARRYPDVTVGLHSGRVGPADGRERITTLSISVPLPLFKRNDAAIGQALTELTQAEIDRASTMRDTQAQVRLLWSRLASQRDRVQRLQRSMVPASSDNRQLALRSRQAGQIGLLEQLIVNRQALDAERELNDALSDLHTTRIELEQATGWPHERSSR